MIADSVENTVSDQCREELLDEKNQKGAGDGGQVEVVNLEQPVQLDRLASTHNLPTSQDDDIVRNERHRGLSESGHGCNALDELELLSWVAENHLPDIAEDGPDGDAEGSIESGKAHFEPWKRHDEGVLCAI